MSQYKHALTIDRNSSEENLVQATQILEHCEGVVILNDIVAFRPMPDFIRCEVIDTEPTAHRCEEEFKVLVENASRVLAESKLANRLPSRPLQWIVVEDNGTAIVELWSES